MESRVEEKDLEIVALKDGLIELKEHLESQMQEVSNEVKLLSEKCCEIERLNSESRIENSDLKQTISSLTENLETNKINFEAEVTFLYSNGKYPKINVGGNVFVALGISYMRFTEFFLFWFLSVLPLWVATINCSRLRKELVSSAEGGEKLEKEINYLQESMKNLREEKDKIIAKDETQKTKLKKDLSVSREEGEKMEMMINNLRDDLKNLHEEKKEIIAKDETQIKLLHEKCDDLENVNNESRKENTTLKKSVSDLTQGRCRKLKKLYNWSNYDNDNDVGVLRILLSLFIFHMLIIIKLKKDLSVSREESEKMEMMIKNLQGDLKNLQEEKEEIIIKDETEIKLLHEKCDDLEKVNNDSSNENTALKKSVSDLTQTLQENKENFQLEITKLKRDLSVSREEGEKMEMKIKNLQGDLKNLQEEKEEIIIKDETEIKLLHKKCDDLETVNYEAKIENTALKKSVSDLTRILQENKENSLLEITRLKKDLSISREEGEKMEKKIKNLQLDLKNLEEEKEKIVEKDKIQINLLSEKCNDLEQRYKECRNENNALKQTVLEVSQKLDKNKENYELQVSRLTKELASSTNEGRILKEEISSLQKTNKSLKNEKKELTFEHEAQVFLPIKSFSSFMMKVKLLRGKCDDLEKMNREWSGENNTLKQNILDLTQKSLKNKENHKIEVSVGYIA
ncbi:hypothetical protein Avbf_06217 [Armadillidium vulgare]|nr:hypothetical protein Avbf_06217 [Armadillidium vulgare]